MTQEMNGQPASPELEAQKRAEIEAAEQAEFERLAAGGKIGEGQAQVSKDCLDTAQLLEAIAAEAREGKVAACCVVKVIGPAQFGLALTGNGLPEQFIGCSFMLDQLKGLISGALVIHNGQIIPKAMRDHMAAQQRPGILRAGTLPPGMVPPNLRG